MSEKWTAGETARRNGGAKCVAVVGVANIALAAIGCLAVCSMGGVAGAVLPMAALAALAVAQGAMLAYIVKGGEI